MEDIFKTAEFNQAAARRLVAQSGIIEAWQSIGAEINPVGSLPTGLLMKHRDIDFHIYTDAPTLEEGMRAIAAINRKSPVLRMEYRDLLDAPDDCVEWHIWLRDGENAEWQIDMIHIRRGSRYDGHFERVAERIKAVLTAETKQAILELKYRTPETEKIMGIEYYIAVIRDGVRTWPEFAEWRKAHREQVIYEWCP